MGILRADRVSHSSLELTGGSIYLDGTGDYLSIASTDAFAFGTGAFTFECWVNRPSLSAAAQICGSSNDNFNLYMNTNGTISLWNGSANITTTNTIDDDTWTHVAICRVGTGTGQMRVFIDGVQAMNSSNTTTYAAGTLLIGRNSSSGSTYGKGYISNLRITRTAEYTKNFTVPKFELENIPGTILLCCRSSSSVTASDITYATITSSGDTTASAVIPSLKKDITDVGVVLADNTKFDTLSYMVPPGGTTTQSNRGRALFGGGSTVINTIQYLNIQSQGNAQDFGDLSGNRYETECAASSTRGIWGGGYTEDTSPNTKVDIIEYVTIATTSNTTDFGNLTVARGHLAGVCNSTRGVFANGTTNPSPHPVVNTIDYITIATAGNATDFGDTTTASKPMGGGRSSTTRGVFTLGNAPSAVNTMEYVTIASTGNSADFGDAIVSGWGRGAGNISSGTRGILGGGNPALNTIEYITIASLGNGTDFGDLVVGRRSSYSAGSTIRGVFGGGKTPTQLNSIEYITIASTGNAQDFGDLINSKSFASGLSDCHGGLS